MTATFHYTTRFEPLHSDGSTGAWHSRVGECCCNPSELRMPALRQTWIIHNDRIGAALGTLAVPVTRWREPITEE